MLLFLYISTASYSLLILSFAIGVIMSEKKTQDIHPQKISVIVAARNEEKHIQSLIDATKAQSYDKDKFELIIADDRSTDRTVEIIKQNQLNFKNLKYVSVKDNEPEYPGKKYALTKAINAAQFEILAFTDADCLPENKWLESISNNFDSYTDVLCGYSPLIGQDNFIGKLKNLERLSIFALCAGSFFWKWAITCSARNWAYRKSLFRKVNGFSGIDHIASGDDDLMLLKLRRETNKFRFMFNRGASVPSFDKTDMKSQVNLETRRASKLKFYPADLKLIVFIALFFYSSIIISLFAAIMSPDLIPGIIIAISCKLLVEFLLLGSFAAKIRKLNLMNVFIPAEILYIPYFILFGLKGTFGKYRWK